MTTRNSISFTKGSPRSLRSWPSRLLLAVFVFSMSLSSRAGERRAEEGSPEITRESLIDQMNLHRKEQGLAPFRGDDRLHRAAEARIEEMIQNGYWGHDPPDGSSPFIWLLLNGYHYRQAGENLAVGLESPAVLVEAWMESPGHRGNILSPDYRDVGIAFIDGGATGRRAGKSVVVLFAREARSGSLP